MKVDSQVSLCIHKITEDSTRGRVGGTCSVLYSHVTALHSAVYNNNHSTRNRLHQ